MALASMTGFARSDDQLEGHAWSWELKSVNGRGLDLRVRVPAGYDALEPRIRNLAGRWLRRGSINVNLQMTRSPASLAYRINRGLLDQVGEIVREAGAGIGAERPRLDGLLALRGIIEVEEQTDSPEFRVKLTEALIGSLERALESLNAVRREEGARLGANITDILTEIEKLADRAGRLAETQPGTLKARLQEAVEDLLADRSLPEERLAQEVALLAAKADVTEELHRLAAHAEAARAILAEPATAEPAGRRLDFLAQEMNREANTLSAKSQDLALTRLALDLKAAIDRLREQIQNIE